MKGVPPGAAKALLQLLFLLVQHLESWTHEDPARKQPFPNEADGVTQAISW